MIQAMNDSCATRLDAMSEDGDFCIPRAGDARMPLLLARAGAYLLDTSDELLAPAGLDGRGYQVLAILATDGPGSQLELARLLGKAPALVVAAIDDLEGRGFVERTRDPADRRRSRVMLTKAGERTLDTADKLADEAAAALLSGLDAGELAQLHDLLLRGLGVSDRTGSALAS
jgi:DNA-binding MarR family transcriptional regulator